MSIIDESGLDILFLKARTYKAWQDKPVSDDLLKQVYEIAKWGPTSANCTPMRVVYVVSKEAKERLKLALDKDNIVQTMAAPATAIIAMDMEFYEKLPKLFPHTDARSWFAGNNAKIETAAFRNSTLQGAYFMLAARALGLDCGPMSGFNNTRLDELFFKGTSWRSNFLCNLGYGDASKLHPRNQRLDFSETCRIE